MNKSISYTKARQNLKKVCDQVCDDHELILVTRKNGENVVIISEEDYCSLEESLHVFKSPKNVERIVQAMHRTAGYNIEQIKHELDIRPECD